MRASLLLLALLSGPGCLGVTWGRESRYSPIPAEALDGLEIGRTPLADCLAAFGAPLWVWEPVEAGRAGAALAYGCFDEEDLGLSLSVPVTESASASFDYDQADRRMKGLVLFFDEGLTLTSWRTGYLRDLTRERRRPPAALEEDT